MAYDVIKLTHPGAPCAVGARVRHTRTGRLGNLVAPRRDETGLWVRFDGEAFPKSVDPRAIAYCDEPHATLAKGR